MDVNNPPKVLIVTVNPLSKTSNNGKTYASFFEGYPKECIAQLYFHREIPTSDVCQNYYKISDEDIIKNFFKPKHRKKLGKQVCFENKEERVISKEINDRLKKSSMIRFIRSLLWLSLDVEDEYVKKWLNEFNPDIIFFCGGNATYLYNKVLRISEIYNAKIIYYITDDYIIPYFSYNIFDLINRAWTRKVFKRMCRYSSLVLTIGDKMTQVYKSRYGVESKKIMNLVNVEKTKKIIKVDKVNNLKFVYVGSLHSNRWKTLSKVGESLKRINDLGFNGKLEIYCPSKPEENILKAISIDGFSEFCGSLDSEEVKNVLNDADVLVHVESFDKNSKKITYLSVSTKIPEYMSSGKCILGIGPKDIASVEYLINSKSAFVVTDIDDDNIDKNIKEIFNNQDKRNFYIDQALLTVKKNHDATIKRKEFQQDIINLKR